MNTPIKLIIKSISIPDMTINSLSFLFVFSVYVFFIEKMATKIETIIVSTINGRIIVVIRLLCNRIIKKAIILTIAGVIKNNFFLIISIFFTNSHTNMMHSTNTVILLGIQLRMLSIELDSNFQTYLACDH